MACEQEEATRDVVAATLQTKIDARDLLLGEIAEKQAAVDLLNQTDIPAWTAALAAAQVALDVCLANQ